MKTLIIFLSLVSFQCFGQPLLHNRFTTNTDTAAASLVIAAANGTFSGTLSNNGANGSLVVSNINHGYYGLSNIVSGQLYTNTWWNGPVRFYSCVQLIKAQVVGASNLGIRTYGFNGAVTNTVADTTTGTSLADTGDFRMIEWTVPFNGSFTLTNLSTGAGNSITLFAVQEQGD